MPTILLTGATGFIGSHLLKKLLEQNYRVVAVVRPGSNTRRMQKHLPQIKTCANDVASLRVLFSTTPIDTVVHLATTYYKQHTTAEEAAVMLETNVTLPATILDLMRECGVKKFIAAGTFFEYDLSERRLLNETAPLRPYNFYAKTKQLFHEVMDYYSQTYDIRTAYLRLFSPYGPDDNDKLVTFLVKSLRSHTPLTLTPGEQQWNFTYVGDIVGALIKAIGFLARPDSTSEVFNIGATETHSIKEVVKTLEEVSGEQTEVSFTKPYPPNEIFYVNCDGIKAKQVLGWEAQTSLREGLEATWNFNSSLT